MRVVAKVQALGEITSDRSLCYSSRLQETRGTGMGAIEILEVKAEGTSFRARSRALAAARFTASRFTLHAASAVAHGAVQNPGGHILPAHPLDSTNAAPTARLTPTPLTGLGARDAFGIDAEERRDVMHLPRDIGICG